LIMIEFIIFLFVFLIVLFAIYIFVLARPNGKMPKKEKLLTDYAHRGLHGKNIPENSLAAFEKAVNEGIGIELDVQLSSDGVVMVFHDYTLIRMTGCDKKLCELTADALQKLCLSETEEKIPTFEQVLALIDGKVPLLVELKGESIDTSLCPKVAEILRKYSGDYCIESFNPIILKSIKKELPDVFCGQLYTNVCRDKKKITPLNIVLSLMAFNFLAKPEFIAYNQKDRNSFPVKLTTKLYKAPNFVWTLRGDEELKKARELKEHPIFEK